jgi:hypothetical protein
LLYPARQIHTDSLRKKHNQEWLPLQRLSSLLLLPSLLSPLKELQFQKENLQLDQQEVQMVKILISAIPSIIIRRPVATKTVDNKSDGWFHDIGNAAAEGMSGCR